MSENVAASRKAAVPTDVVLSALVEGRKAGLTNNQIAEKLGMNPGTFSVRVTKLRQRFAADAAAKKAEGVTVVNPFDAIDAIKVSRKKNVFDSQAAVLEKLNAVDE
jgi:DNA-binding Lrp family transcriptional regulator